MRIAVISDVHGNLPALEAVLADLEEELCDRVVMAGDFAFGGPWPAECIEVIRERGIPAVRGNTDEFLVEVGSGGRIPAQVRTEAQRHTASPALRARYEWTVGRLSAEHLDYLASLPLAYLVPAPGGAGLTIVHATPWNCHDTVQPDAPEATLQAMLDAAGGQALSYGHIHVQYARALADRLVVAVGSVGLPFDGDQRAAYAILTFNEDQGRWNVEFRRVAYDVSQTIAALRASSMPGAEGQIAVLETARPPQG
jgi:predicted phosphodiesterase